MTRRLEGKVALVVGAGSRGEPAGTGSAAAVLFAREGARVLLADKSRERADETLRQIEAEGGSASVWCGDVTSEAACRAMLEACREEYGGLQILYNNVATYGTGKVTEIDEQDLDDVFAINLKSAMLTCKYAVPLMKSSGGGSIIKIASIDGLRTGFTPNAPYAVTKAGLVAADARDGGCIMAAMASVSTAWRPGIFMALSSVILTKIRVSSAARPVLSARKARPGMWLGRRSSSQVTKRAGYRGVVLPVDGGLLAATPLSVLHHLV